MPKSQKTHFFASGNVPKAKLGKNSIRALAQRLIFGLFRLRLSAQKPNLDYSDFGTPLKAKKLQNLYSGSGSKAKKRIFPFRAICRKQNDRIFIFAITKISVDTGAVIW
ncbi:MAG: hypothetical protein II811_02360 [Spirochaetaceae bacterium]|nr:hypothetical protein [Spirochaetaceae bacterium]